MQTLSTFDEKLATILINELTTTSQMIGVHRTAFDKLRLRRGAHYAATSFDRLGHENREIARRMESFMARGRGGAGHYADLECGHA